jgi:hypothetical protein
MRDLAALLDCNSGSRTVEKDLSCEQFPQNEPGCVILRLRLLPRLCCAVPLVQYLI